MNVLEKILEEVKTIKRNQNSSNQDFATGYISALSTVEGIMCSHMVEHNGDNTEMVGWIPVEERLPEGGQEVLATLIYGDGYMDVYTYCDGDWESGDYGLKHYETNEVLAWMPLPEPYKPKEDN